MRRMPQNTAPRRAALFSHRPALLMACLLALPVGARGGEPLEYRSGEGTRVRIHSAELLLQDRIEIRDGRAILRLPGVPPEELRLPAGAGGAADQAAYYPHSPSVALAALESLAEPCELGEVDLYLLPYPRARLAGSSSAGKRIWLSPGASPPLPASTHMLLTHELGHIWHNEHLGPAGSPAWRLYRRLRGLEDEAIYNEAAPHSQRPREILAEDFRVLLGGPLANYCGGIENRELPLPGSVPGLLDFFLAPPLRAAMRGVAFGLTARSYPNPCNAETRILLSAESAPPGAALGVAIYDAAGHRVRRLHAGTLTARRMAFDWDGRDDSGRALPSGLYWARLRVGEADCLCKLLLVQ